MQALARSDAPSVDGAIAEATYFAFVHVTSRPSSRTAADEVDADWIAVCHHLSERVERTSGRSALLELGTCSDEEARAVVRSLLERLATLGLEARAGVGPSGVLAQVALLGATSERPLASVSREEVTALVRRQPISMLLQLHPQGIITPEIVERLQRYGLLTLGHVARIGEVALRRQFGAAGSFLAAVAQGRDVRPLCPTPPPAELRIRARLTSPVLPEEVLALLPQLAERVAARLRIQGRQACALHLVVRWESGTITRSRLTLRKYTNSPTLLTQELRRLLAPLLATLDRIEELRLALGNFAPAVPTQATIWRTRRQQVAAIEQVAQMLARRHGRALVLQPRLATPAAVFSEERYTLAEPDGLLPTGTENAAGGGGRGAANPDDTWRDAWRHVPQRIHWW